MHAIRAELRYGQRPRDGALRLRKGDIIYCQGDPGGCWYEVVSGIVRTCHFHVDGHRQLTGFYYEGDIFGVEVGPREAAAEAVTDIILRRRDAAAGDALPRQARALEQALERANQCIVLLGRRHARERIAAFLLFAARRLAASGRYVLPMSRSDVADHLGLTVHTVSRTIAAFARRGLIALDGPQMVRLIDREGLRAIADDAARPPRRARKEGRQ